MKAEMRLLVLRDKGRIRKKGEREKNKKKVHKMLWRDLIPCNVIKNTEQPNISIKGKDQNTFVHDIA